MNTVLENPTLPPIQSWLPQRFVVISTKDGTRPPLLLTQPRVRIGRFFSDDSHSNDIIIDERVVSNYHLELLRNEVGEYELRNVSSTNGTMYQGQLLKQPKIVRHGDVFHIMENRKIYVTLTFYERIEQDGIQASHLKKTIRKKVGTFKRETEIVLDDVSLVIPPRKFIAIVGGSGAGKSTLLKALNRTHPADSGVLLYNGNTHFESLTEFNTHIGYVPQDDIVHRDLTVERALYYGAKLRPAIGESVKARVDDVLASLELTEHRTKRIKHLSGGQRKRVSIALELLAEPKFLFLDEPTSGLDPALDYKIMEKLRILADKGHTIVLVTHATENIQLCDYVCFLDKGRLVYFGNPSQALLFFARFFKKYFHQEKFSEMKNFADIYRYLEIDNSSDSSFSQLSVSENARKAFQQTNEFMQYCVPKQNSSQESRAVPDKQFKLRNPWKQFVFLTLRYIELFKNDWRNFLFLMLQPLVVALLLFCFIRSGIGTDGFAPTKVVQCPSTAQVLTRDGYVDIPHIAPGISSPASMPVSLSCKNLEHYLQTNTAGRRYAAHHGGTIRALQNFLGPGPGDAPTILFIMAFAAVMFGCVNAVREIVKETTIYEREHTIGVGNLPYLFSKIVVLGTICLLQSAILVGIVHSVDPFPSTFLAGEIYLTILLTAWAGLMMGLLISAIVTNNELATSLIPLILLPQVIFSGTLFPLTKQYPFLQWFAALFPIRWSMAALGSIVGLHSDKINGDQLFGNNYIYHGTVYSVYSQIDALRYLQFIWLALSSMIIVFTSMTFICLLLKGWRMWHITHWLLLRKQKRNNKRLSLTQSPPILSPMFQTQLCPRCGTFLHLTAELCNVCKEPRRVVDMSYPDS